MSAIQGNQAVWPVNDGLNTKHEKCLNITEEIYKRINITFQIKKLETATQSDITDQSDQIDSNELSNETDLFACDKSSISSSTEAEKQVPAKYVNINNNEEKPRPAVVSKKPRKRFRKRVKKRQNKKQSDSDGSSDEALPLSRIVDVDIDKCTGEDRESLDNIMGVPNILIVAKDLKPKTKCEKQPIKKDEIKQKETPEGIEQIERDSETASCLLKEAKLSMELKNCTMCSLSFRGDRGLR
ncbi:hypothetical protein evm_009306 [Chilo suppressalis]|nr:hypothetical protein evm_009306 [Chilo suppressalis]